MVVNYYSASGHFIYFCCMEVTAKTARQLRLTEEEFEVIKQKLGRTPNFNELCAFRPCGVNIAVIKIRLSG